MFDHLSNVDIIFNPNSTKLFRHSIMGRRSVGASVASINLNMMIIYSNLPRCVFFNTLITSVVSKQFDVVLN